MSTHTPRHLEARTLGADLKRIKTLTPLKHLDSWQVKNVDLSAVKIREAWDYRAVGLTVDQARAKIREWLESSHHPDLRVKPVTGRIGDLQKSLGRLRLEVKEAAEAINKIVLCTSETKPGWQQYRVRIQVGDRTIIIKYHEDVTWGDRKNAQWPESTQRWYTAHLLRSDYMRPPTAREYQDYKIGFFQDSLPYFTEREITHNLRGSWWARVITELLGPEYAKLFSWEKSSVPCYKIVEQNGCLRSVYNPEFTYPLGEWKTDRAQPDHQGGIYAYLDDYAALTAAQNSDVFNHEWAAGKTLVLCECQGRGRTIKYTSGKIAFSELQILRVIKALKTQ
ncbi:MAG: hypothetical protein U1D67_10585 [Dehalococcoidia bacterium]|nr:hypothetical protein [Dehalococcoidia bacterium]